MSPFQINAFTQEDFSKNTKKKKKEMITNWLAVDQVVLEIGSDSNRVSMV